MENFGARARQENSKDRQFMARCIKGIFCSFSTFTEFAHNSLHIKASGAVLHHKYKTLPLRRFVHNFETASVKNTRKKIYIKTVNVFSISYKRIKEVFHAILTYSHN